MSFQYKYPQTIYNPQNYKIGGSPTVVPPNKISEISQKLNTPNVIFTNNAQNIQPEPKKSQPFQYGMKPNNPNSNLDKTVTPINSLFRSNKIESTYQPQVNVNAQQNPPIRQQPQHQIHVPNLPLRSQPTSYSQNNNYQNIQPKFKQNDNMRDKQMYDQLKTRFHQLQKELKNQKGQKKQKIAILQQFLKRIKLEKQNMKNNYEEKIKEKQALLKKKDQILMKYQQQVKSLNLKTKKNSTNKQPIRMILQNFLSWACQNIPWQTLRNFIKEHLSYILDSYNQENQNTNQIVNDLKRSNQYLTDGINQFTRTNQMLQNQIRLLKGINDNLGQQNDRLNQHISCMERKFNQERNKIHQHYQYQISQINNQNANRIHNFQCKINQITNEKNNLLNQINTQQKNKSQINVNFNQNYLKLVMEHDKLVKSQKQTAKKLTENQKQLIKKIQQIDKLFEKNQSIQKSIQQLHKKLTTYVDEIQTLKTKIHNLNCQIDKRNNQKQSLIQQLNLLKSSQQQSKRKLNEKSTQIKKSNQQQIQKDNSEKIKQLQSQIVKLKQQNAKNQPSINTINRVNKFLQGFPQLNDSREHTQPIKTDRSSRSNQSVLRGKSIKSRQQDKKLKQEYLVKKQQDGLNENKLYTFRTKIRDPVKY